MVWSARRGDVSRHGTENDLESFLLADGFELQRHRDSADPLEIHDLRASQFRPFRQNLPNRHIAGEERHAAVAEFQLQVGPGRLRQKCDGSCGQENSRQTHRFDHPV
jgi:hypothetical protein